MSIFEDIAKCTGFQWDEGNDFKNWEKHRVARAESERVFRNVPLFIGRDDEHSQRERRYAIYGQTNEGRLLVVIFTIRGENIRIISARDMTHEERTVYEDAQEET